jgi:hypothetical protein
LCKGINRFGNRCCRNPSRHWHDPYADWPLRVDRSASQHQLSRSTFYGEGSARAIQVPHRHVLTHAIRIWSAGPVMAAESAWRVCRCDSQKSHPAHISLCA